MKKQYPQLVQNIKYEKLLLPTCLQEVVNLTHQN